MGRHSGIKRSTLEKGKKQIKRKKKKLEVRGEGGSKNVLPPQKASERENSGASGSKGVLNKDVPSVLFGDFFGKTERKAILLATT